MLFSTCMSVCSWGRFFFVSEDKLLFRKVIQGGRRLWVYCRNLSQEMRSITASKAYWTPMLLLCSPQQTSEFPLVYNNRTSLEETPFFTRREEKKLLLKNHFWNSRLSFIIPEKNYDMRLFLQQTSKFTLLYSNRKTNLGNIFL